MAFGIPIALGILTRKKMMAVALHIALSLFVFKAVKDRKSRYLFWVAILLHALINAVIVIIANHGFLALAEAETLAGTSLICVFAWKTVWNDKNNNGNQY